MSKASPNARRSRRQLKSLRFNFIVDEKSVDRRLKGSIFAAKEPTVKLLFAIGQASLFSQTDEQYRGYISRLTNKGLPEHELLSGEAIDSLLSEIINAGYATNGGSRYKLTQQALGLLLDDGGATQANTEVNYPTCAEEQDNKENFQAIEIIKPLGLPLLSSQDTTGWIDESQLIADKKYVSSFGFRSLEILAELELAGGVIVSKDKYRGLGGEISARLDSGIGGDSYIKSIDILAAQGFVDINEDGALILTDQGMVLIALLKTYPEEQRKPNAQKFQKTTALNIIEHILKETGFDLDPDAPINKLPEHSDWLRAHGRQESILPTLSKALGKSEDSIARRIHDLKNLKHYVETATSNHEHEREYSTNIRVAKKGLEFALLAMRALRDKEKVLAEDEVEEAMELYDGCLHLAEGLGDENILRELRRQFDKRSLFEYKEDEFIQEKNRLKTLFEQLRQRYVFELSPAPLVA